MLKERLQVLVNQNQRRRLQHEAARRGVSVGAVVRDAIDASLGGGGRDQRVRAAHSMGKGGGGEPLPNEELERLIAEEREDNLSSGRRP